jgi:signal transduction histidine kinase
MRMPVKQQVLIAPATIFVLLIFLLVFLQYSYWSLVGKRQEIQAVESTYSALAEADMAARRLHVLIRTLQNTNVPVAEDMALATELYERLQNAVNRIKPFGPLNKTDRIAQLHKLTQDLNPTRNSISENTAATFANFRVELSNLSNLTQVYSHRLKSAQAEDINGLVERSAIVVMSVLFLAILLGMTISLYFSRRIFLRIKTLSTYSAQIAAGKVEAPEPPHKMKDELDIVALSVHRMAKKLVQVVGTEKLLEGAEEERRRISMDLHDQTLSDLSGILRRLDSLAATDPDPEHRDKVNQLSEDLKRAISNLRDIMNNLHPQALEILGIGAAIEAHLTEHCCSEDLPIYNLHITQEAYKLKLDRKQQLSIYRIAIEAIQNVIKHAHASRYEVNLEVCEGCMLFSVEDNGCGMPQEQSYNKGHGHGLNNIRERAKVIGAEVTWKESRFTSGTRFELNFPLANNAGDLDEQS